MWRAVLVDGRRGAALLGEIRRVKTAERNCLDNPGRTDVHLSNMTMTLVRIALDVPYGAKRWLKIEAAKQGITVKEYIVRLLAAAGCKGL